MIRKLVLSIVLLLPCSVFAAKVTHYCGGTISFDVPGGLDFSKIKKQSKSANCDSGFWLYSTDGKLRSFVEILKDSDEPWLPDGLKRDETGRIIDSTSRMSAHKTKRTVDYFSPSGAGNKNEALVVSTQTKDAKTGSLTIDSEFYFGYDGDFFMHAKFIAAANKGNEKNFIKSVKLLFTSMRND